ncbi:energy transducer TonB [bacterium]|nr:energy transducer TonB [bacterium]
MDTNGKRGSAKESYPKVVEISAIVALLLVTVVFLVWKTDRRETAAIEPEETVLEVTDVPYIPPAKLPPAPERPSLPIEDPEMPLEDDLTMIESDVYQYPDFDVVSMHSFEDDPVDFFAVEKRPEMIGGVAALYRYMMDNKLYPDFARRNGQNGKVLIQFTVGEDGKPYDFEVLGERPLGFGFADAAIEAISAMRFTPGMQRDRAVKVRMQQPIEFRTK